ncbi:MAG: sulfatase-like hydrolase/transferase, partial [Proteobacteria bacterium]|nr:sulfatase-like hydrolase/transferase [Pseudomonadota bacterium]
MKKYIRWSSKLLFTAILFILIFNPRLLGIQKQLIPVTPLSLWQEIKGIDVSVFWKWFLIAMAIQASGFLANVVRWNLLLKGQAIGLPFSHLLGSFLVARFFGIFLPGTIGLDGYRLYDVARHTGKLVESTTVILIEKLTGFIALTFLLFITLPLGMRFLKVNLIILVAILLVLGIFIVVSFLLLFNPRIIQIVFAIIPIPMRTKIQGKLDKIALAVTAYGGQAALLMRALACGFLVHLCTTLMYFATAMSIKTANIHILDILFASPIMIYGTVLGPSIGGEGIREAVFALLLGNMAGPAKAILFAHLGFWVGGILSLAGGVIFMIRPAEYRPQVKEMKEVLKASQQRIAVRQMPPEEIQRIKENAGKSVAAGIWMGLWAGALVGLLEGLVIICSFPTLAERTVLYYGPLLYGIAGGLMGIGYGMLASIISLFRHRNVDERIWAFMFCAIFTPLAFIIARFRMVRDFLNEKPPSLVQELILFSVFAVLTVGLFLVLKQCSKTRAFRFLAKGYGLAGFWAVFICGAFLYCTAFSSGNLQSPPFAPVQPSTGKPGPNIILILIDALRANHLSCYGYTKVKSPAIDSLARDGILYTRHFAQSSWTKPQCATIFTSLYPSTHNTYLKPHVLPDSVETLAEVLQKSGYRTGAVVTNINLAPQFNFQQGFDYYCYLDPDFFFYAKDSSSRLCLYNLLRLIRERFLFKKKYVNNFYQDAVKVTARASTWLDRNKNLPFFLYLHYMEPHDPYFAHPYNGQAVARVTTPNPLPEKADMMRGLYDGEIFYCDEKIGELFR